MSPAEAEPGDARASGFASAERIHIILRFPNLPILLGAARPLFRVRHTGAVGRRATAELIDTFIVVCIRAGSGG